MRGGYRLGMKITKPFAMAGAVLALLGVCAPVLAVDAVDASAQRRGEQDDARKQLRAGEVKSLREIEAIVLPRMSGKQYVGFNYYPAQQMYRLRFIEDGRVIFVDVDARTGAIIAQRQ